MKLIGLALVTLIAASFLFVRFAPSDPERWHTAIQGNTDKDFPGGALRVVAAAPDALPRADAYMRNLPRTRVISGSVDAGRVTYVTRSAVFGFPDYTTIEYENGRLKAYARLRFGRSDLGVNSERLQGLLAALEAG